MRLSFACPSFPAPEAFQAGTAPCALCRKRVHDFTDKTAEEVAAIRAADPEACGKWYALRNGHLATRPVVRAAIASVIAACGPASDVALADQVLVDLSAWDGRAPPGRTTLDRTAHTATAGARALMAAVERLVFAAPGPAGGAPAGADPVDLPDRGQLPVTMGDVVAPDPPPVEPAWMGEAVAPYLPPAAREVPPEPADDAGEGEPVDPELIEALQAFGGADF